MGTYKLILKAPTGTYGSGEQNITPEDLILVEENKNEDFQNEINVINTKITNLDDELSNLDITENEITLRNDYVAFGATSGQSQENLNLMLQSYAFNNDNTLSKLSGIIYDKSFTFKTSNENITDFSVLTPTEDFIFYHNPDKVLVKNSAISDSRVAAFFNGKKQLRLYVNKSVFTVHMLTEPTADIAPSGYTIYPLTSFGGLTNGTGTGDIYFQVTDVDTNVSDFVDKSSNQTITGNKTFDGVAVFNNFFEVQGNATFGSNDVTIEENLEVQGHLTVSQSITADGLNISSLNIAPTSSTDTGTVGEIRYTTDYIYVCVATNTWKRSPLTTW